MAWVEQAYSWRMLARAVKTTRYRGYDRIRMLNSYTERPELVPANGFPIE